MAVFHGVSLLSMTFNQEQFCGCCCHSICVISVSSRLLLFPWHCPSVGIQAGRADLGLAATGGMVKMVNQGLLPVSDMEIMCAQGLCCDPAQPLHTNRNNWVWRPGLVWRHGQRGQEIATQRHTLLLNLNFDCSCQRGIMALECAGLLSSVCGRFFFWNRNNAGKWLAWG